MMRMFKTTAGGMAVAGLVLAAACGNELDGEAGESGTAHRIDVDRVAADLPVSEPLVAFGDLLLAAADGGDGGRVGVFQSADLGESWEQVELPGWPDGPSSVKLGKLTVEGELAILTGFVGEGGHHYIWATSDGTDWHGGRFQSEVRNTSSYDLEVAALEGRLVAAVEGEGPHGSDRVDVQYSDDSGATWTPCLEDESDRQACASVFARSQEADGERWRSPIIEPDLGPDASNPELIGRVELSGGGWLATGRANETGDQSRGLLLRSDDGVHWQQLLDPDPCREDDATEGRPNSGVSAPVPVGDGWLVWYSCSGLVNRLWSRLYVLEADGTGLTELSDGLDSKGDYGQPVAVGDVVVLPELDGDRMVAVIRLRDAVTAGG